MKHKFYTQLCLLFYRIEPPDPPENKLIDTSKAHSLVLAYYMQPITQLTETVPFNLLSLVADSFVDVEGTEPSNFSFICSSEICGGERERRERVVGDQTT